VYLLPFADHTDILARLRIPGGGIMNNGSGATAEDLSGRFLSEVVLAAFDALESDDFGRLLRCVF
jgi:hypothetical protein